MYRKVSALSYKNYLYTCLFQGLQQKHWIIHSGKLTRFNQSDLLNQHIFQSQQIWSLHNKLTDWETLKLGELLERRLITNGDLPIRVDRCWINYTKRFPWIKCTKTTILLASWVILQRQTFWQFLRKELSSVGWPRPLLGGTFVQEMGSP